jgi:regulator of nucleoside diphosphate kinase
VLAPVGTALLGYREGDVIEWPTPGGVRVLKIEKLLHQPEAAARPRRVVES